VSTILQRERLQNVTANVTDKNPRTFRVTLCEERHTRTSEKNPARTFVNRGKEKGRAASSPCLSLLVRSY
jgi:hypothetical protein